MSPLPTLLQRRKSWGLYCSQFMKITIPSRRWPSLNPLIIQSLVCCRAWGLVPNLAPSTQDALTNGLVALLTGGWVIEILGCAHQDHGELENWTLKSANWSV